MKLQDVLETMKDGEYFSWHGTLAFCRHGRLYWTPGVEPVFADAGFADGWRRVAPKCECCPSQLYVCKLHRGKPAEPKCTCCCGGYLYHCGGDEYGNPCPVHGGTGPAQEVEEWELAEGKGGFMAGTRFKIRRVKP